MKPAFIPALLSLAAISIAAAFGTAAANARAQWKGIAASQPQEKSKTSIEVENWTKPEPGWLYVLDSRPDAGKTPGRIWLVDPETGETKGSIRTGYRPDFALSPDGSELYIASDPGFHTSEFAAVDVSTGEIVHGETIHNRVEPLVLESYSTMSVTADGQFLRYLADGEHDGEFEVDTIVTKSGALLGRHVFVGNCGNGQFISLPSVEEVEFLCPTMNKVRILHTDPESSKVIDSTWGAIPWKHTIGVAEAFPTHDGKQITIVRGDGAIFQMDLATLSFRETAVHGHSEDHIPPAAWAGSPDGDKVYLGYVHWAGETFPNAIADEFRVYDTSTWKKLATVKTSVPFWSAVSSLDGKRLYAIVPQQHCILMIDTETLKEIRSISVGGLPALAIVAP
jgi:DNA-binding beta-propeller fold protein YncE